MADYWRDVVYHA